MDIFNLSVTLVIGVCIALTTILLFVAAIIRAPGAIWRIVSLSPSQARSEPEKAQKT